jgi:hypothetical protein
MQHREALDVLSVQRDIGLIALEFSIGIFAETTIAASGFAPVKLPSGLRIALPPPALTAASMPLQIEVAPRKSALVLSLPCHDRVQPPVCLVMLSAPAPATRMRCPRGSIGRTRADAGDRRGYVRVVTASGLCRGLPRSRQGLIHIS